MFYCAICADNRRLPITIAKSWGKCEICGETALCFDKQNISITPPNTDYYKILSDEEVKKIEESRQLQFLMDETPHIIKRIEPIMKEWLIKCRDNNIPPSKYVNSMEGICFELLTRANLQNSSATVVSLAQILEVAVNKMMEEKKTKGW